MEHRFHTLDVFTDRVFGGNPLAVFPDARGLSGATMQRIARELNLSETVFVLPAENAANTRRVRIFTPAMELPFAGHPTVGTALLLAMLGEVAVDGGTATVVLEEGVGPVRVEIEAPDGVPSFARLSVAQLPERGPQPHDAGTLAALLSLDEGDVRVDDVETWSSGVAFLVIPVRDRAALGRVRLDPATWSAKVAGEWAPHVYVVAQDEAGLAVRMFAPAMGIAEDPATGAAAAALGGWIAARAGVDEGTIVRTVEQGTEMGRPSRLRVEVVREGGRTTAVRVGGSAVRVSDGTMRVPDDAE